MSRRSTLPSPLRELAAALGGVQALADECGVTTRSIGRYASGQRRLPKLVRAHVNAMARRRGLPEPWPVA